jgi:biotin operon repressor
VIHSPFFKGEKMLKLEDIRPRPSKFKLEATGKTYKLRPFNVEDEAWLKQEFGEKINDYFSEKNIDPVALTRIAYRLMIDRSDFKKKTITEIDENGEEFKTSIGGYRLLMSMISGMKEKEEILLAINETIGLSREAVEKLHSEIMKDKKKVEKNKKKQIGPTS